MRRASSAVLVSLVLVARSASADAPPSNEAAAEALFNEGRALVEAGRVDEGCRKLEASQKLDPGTGTLIHLGDCNEKLGRTATAWAHFRDAASRAARDGRSDWEGIAKARAAELDPMLAKLRVDAPSGVVVRRDDQEIPAAALGSALPTDPGEYAIVASAPGKKPWTTRVRVRAASLTTVTVPPLEDDARAGDTGAAEKGGSPLRAVGYAVGAVGLVGLGVGTVSGLVAISDNRRSKSACPESGICADESARSDNESARTAATISTIGFIAGGALLVGGVALVLAAPSAPARPVARVRASAQAIWLEGTW